MISYKEYKQEVIASMHRLLLPEDYIEEIVEGGHLYADYLRDVWATEFLCTNQLSTDAYGYHMLYPDLPYTDEQLRKIFADARVLKE